MPRGEAHRPCVHGPACLETSRQPRRCQTQTEKVGAPPSPSPPPMYPCGRQWRTHVCRLMAWIDIGRGAVGHAIYTISTIWRAGGSSLSVSLPVRGRAHQGCAAGIYVGCGGHRLCGGSAAREGCAGLPAAWAKRLMWGFRDWGLGQPQIGLPQPRDNPCHGMAWHGLSPDGVLSLP